MEYISIEAVVSLAKEQLDIEGTSTDPFLRKMVFLGIRRTRTAAILVDKEENLPVSGRKRVNLPPDLQLIHSLKTESGKCPKYLPSDFNICSKSCKTINVVGDEEEYERLTFTNDKDYIYFSREISDSTITLRYKGMNTDEEGVLKVPLDHESCLADYVCYRYALRHIDVMGTGAAQFYKRDWMAQKRYLHGKHKQLGSEELKHLGNLWNRVVPSPYRI